jgi:hypothetical protein
MHVSLEVVSGIALCRTTGQVLTGQPINWDFAEQEILKQYQIYYTPDLIQITRIYTPDLEQKCYICKNMCDDV